MKVAKTRAFGEVRRGAKPIPASVRITDSLFADDEDDDGADLHRLEKGEIAPFQRTHQVKSRATAPAELPSAGD